MINDEKAATLPQHTTIFLTARRIFFEIKMLHFDKISFSDIRQPQPLGQNSQLRLSPSGLSPDDTLRQLICSNPALQMMLSKSDKMSGYLAMIPVISRELEIQEAQARQLSLLFRRVALSERFDGSPVFAVCRLTPRAQEIWHGLLASHALDPLFLHFSGRADEPYPDQPFSVECYALYAAASPAQKAREDFLRQPWVKSVLSDDVLGDALPAIEVPGWTLEELIADPAVCLLASCVAHLYYCAFTGTPHFARQLRYVL